MNAIYTNNASSEGGFTKHIKLVLALLLSVSSIAVPPAGGAELRAVYDVSLDAEIREAQENLDALLLRYTDKHPDVIAARGRLAELVELKRRQSTAAATTPAQRALMHELRVCLNVDGAKAVPADVVLSCPNKGVGILVGVSRDALFGALGRPTGCRHADGSSEAWSRWDYEPCRDAVDVYYFLWPPCKVGPGIPAILGVLFSSAGVVTQSRWAAVELWAGITTCIP